ncbi:formimidoylglutamase [Amphritea atlantica]|uniref:Formimidoylglutamase n=1 Tax=Amphritea atlantica TaxID=355243 RepID=A0ABY5GS80_9GAMM|nr:formimidoylglutamase [Amphritea atlantica]
MSGTKFKAIWSGRTDSEEAEELATRLHQVIVPFSRGEEGLAIVGFCSDEGVSRNKGRKGARNAPDQLRRALANLPWSSNRQAYDAGNIICEDDQLEQAHEDLANRVSDCLAGGHFTFVLGGGHEVAYGNWLGLVQHFESQESVPLIGIINFDAHFDLRLDRNGCSSGTPFYQIAKQCEQKKYPFKYSCFGVSEVANSLALFNRADLLGVSYRKDSDMGVTALDEITNQLEQFIDDCDVLYLTIDLDVLPASEAPGVSAPASRGVGLEVLEPLIETIKSSGKLKLADIAEYNPVFDIDNRTARVAARLFYNIVK